MFRLHVSRAYAVALRLSANPGLAEEITKDSFLTTWQQISHLRENVSFSLWITGITVYSALEKFRDKNSANKFGKGVTSGGTPYETKDEKLLLVEKAILSLPDTDRFIVVLRDVENYSQSEVADLLALKTEEVLLKFSATVKLLEGMAEVQHIDSPVSEIIKKLPLKIEPPRDLWNDILREMHTVKAKSSKGNANYDNEENQDKKKGFTWFKKGK